MALHTSPLVTINLQIVKVSLSLNAIVNYHNTYDIATLYCKAIKYLNEYYDSYFMSCI
jgi:hypothetical protein